MKKVWRENGLSITLVLITLLTLVGNALTGWHENNNERSDYGAPPLALGDYLGSGHFMESVFENWESEFLQMGLYVLLTVFLYQKGSAESKDPDQADHTPSPSRPNALRPFRRGGWVRTLYENSLSITFFLLFTVSFFLHALGGAKQYNLEQALKGKAERVSLWQFLGSSEFWFQSLQNWQSEFLSVLAIVVLTIFLRQKGSPESKPVDAPDDETGG